MVARSAAGRLAAAFRSGRRCRRLAAAVIVVIAGLCWPQPAAMQTAGFQGSEVEAVFLFNFAQFIEWPAAAFSDPRSSFIIGILGDDPFGRVLDDVVRGEVVDGHALVVERFSRVEDIDVCHILFVGQIEEARYLHTFAALQGRAILTVGEVDGFSVRGGAIRFVTANNRIRLRINVDAAKAAHLTISSKLLRSAEIVRGGKQR
jgi:hypothetical protein